ncbi:hypothetical protein AB0C29_30305, partial [Actinoplanes sp. NPDC048791]|uniref:hypothetical protein n=1 Tax=Actinoplanes sp. NPDC048791 TaxID=3154623 RepID=UPI0033CFFAF7
MPDGPVRRFYERLHDLHASAGRPSMRELQRATRGERRPRGINPTTIHDAFSRPRLARWEVVEEIVTRLGGDPEEFGRLWRQAREVQARDADLAAVAVGRTPVAASVPRQLPPDVWAYTGRQEHLKALDELLAGDRTALVITAIAGM